MLISIFPSAGFGCVLIAVVDITISFLCVELNLASAMLQAHLTSDSNFIFLLGKSFCYFAAMDMLIIIIDICVCIYIYDMGLVLTSSCHC